MLKILEAVNGFVWGVPALVLILGTGLYLSVTTGFAQLRLFPRAFRAFVRQFSRDKAESGTVSPYQALCTALAATVGTGNMVGVAGAIALGGPGAVFWMWICAVLGMVIKYAEAVLAVRFRKKEKNGEYVGGPMYMILHGLDGRWKSLSYVYCFLGVIASFGVGNAAQINSLIGGINSAIVSLGGTQNECRDLFIGIVLAAVILCILFGGARRIGTAAERLVPFAAVGYILMCSVVLVLRAQAIPDAFRDIIIGAFAPRAVTGGLLGSAFQAIRIGVSRGVFTNEAGMGTAAIAHAGANVKHAAEQGLMGIMEVFLDTIVICTMTALVILCSGVDIPYGADTGILLTVQAFACVLGEWISMPIAIFLCCFAFATVLGWGLYGGRCAQFLFGQTAWRPFALLQGLAVIAGAVSGTGIIWMLSETVNGLMVIPNLIALVLLSPELIRLTLEYRKKRA